MPPLSEIFGGENKEVTQKLFRYSAAMLIAPIFTFFFLLHVVFESDSTKLGYAGIGAVVVANAVIVAYVIMAFNEDADEGDKRKSKSE